MMIDAYMEQLDKVIQEAGIENNSIIIFTSDNGCSPQADFKLLDKKNHHPSYIYRGHKADIYEGGHRVPYIVKWPTKIKEGSVSNEIICTTDLLATCSEIVGNTLLDNEGEDSYSFLPILEQKKLNKPLREATVHHSIHGNFAIRKGNWKLIMCPGSGGWSFPNPKINHKAIDSLPPIQLYNLKSDPGEITNLQANNTDIVKELKALLIKYIKNGRSTPGVSQKNDSINFAWKQIEFIDE
jgi:arylsulfatase A-like enzyme